MVIFVALICSIGTPSFRTISFPIASAASDGLHEHEQLQQWIEAAKAQTADTLKNLTQTMGIVEQINGQMTFLPLTEFYQRTIDAAILDITSGAFDYKSVLKRTVNTLARSGIRTIDYASGYSSRVAVAARRAVMTGITQMTGRITDYNAEKLGAKYYEVAWHANARPSHRVWQGKVWSKEQLVTVCGLGSVTGLCGVNCYHEYYPFFPGISERNWTDEWLREQNAKEDTPRTWRRSASSSAWTPTTSLRWPWWTRT